jgi:hypothetical protein
MGAPYIQVHDIVYDISTLYMTLVA